MLQFIESETKSSCSCKVQWPRRSAWDAAIVSLVKMIPEGEREKKYISTSRVASSFLALITCFKSLPLSLLLYFTLHQFHRNHSRVSEAMKDVSSQSLFFQSLGEPKKESVCLGCKKFQHLLDESDSSEWTKLNPASLMVVRIDRAQKSSTYNKANS